MVRLKERIQELEKMCAISNPLLEVAAQVYQGFCGLPLRALSSSVTPSP